MVLRLERCGRSLMAIGRNSYALLSCGLAFNMWVCYGYRVEKIYQLNIHHEGKGNLQQQVLQV